MKVTDKQLETLISDLLGTCQSLEEACLANDFDNDWLTQKQLNYLDSQIFLCDQCSWWCSTAELENYGDGDLCVDCSESFD